jgi:hypothetical protein
VKDTNDEVVARVTKTEYVNRKPLRAKLWRRLRLMTENTHLHVG